ncbi:putative Metal dependent phosphohydrolase [Desulfosarcina cetonica]|uniref:HDOD domain-containing protein n=1 Tax=Desulfosarcina cetonica TaxID=90730 RepID=UPI0006D105AC|nr:HDOD domain-containing protein [Desulfosarcina cetonica]VTR68946.1 putative Metal dependent phosphohydrolase [Desulfosarcina cetonica]
MAYIAVDNLKQGMVLDADVHDVNTRLLLSKGQKIAPNHIRILKIWGISGVSIVGSANEKDEDVPPIDDKNLERIKKAINLVFKNADLKNPLIREVYKNSLIHRLKGAFGNSPTLNCHACTENPIPSKPEKLKNRIDQSDIKLPDAPTIIKELNQVIDDPLATSNDVAQVVTKSPSLTAILLKIVNSAYYGFPSKIDRISRAVTIIGTKEISGLALGICVMQAFKDIPKDILNMDAFLRHSLSCGMVSRILAAQNNLAQTEQLFVAGLLHDIGKLVVCKYYPEHAKVCLESGFVSNASIFEAEKKIFGLAHPQIAKLLLTKWNLPSELTSDIVCHHAPSKAHDPQKAGIVHLADMISHGLGIGSSGERSIPHFDYHILDNMTNSIDRIKTVFSQIIHQFSPMDAIFSDISK